MKKNNLTITPDSGSGGATINVTAAEEKTGISVNTSFDISGGITRTVATTQDGKVFYMNIDVTLSQKLVNPTVRNQWTVLLGWNVLETNLPEHPTTQNVTVTLILSMRYNSTQVLNNIKVAIGTKSKYSWRTSGSITAVGNITSTTAPVCTMTGGSTGLTPELQFNFS